MNGAQHAQARDPYLDLSAKNAIGGGISPVGEALHNLDTRQEDTKDLLGQLAHKLAPVLMPRMPEPAGGTAATGRPEGAPLADELLAAVDRQGAVNAALRDLIARLAV